MKDKIKESSFGKLNIEDLKKVSKGALIVGGATMATFMLEWIITCDFGAYTGIVIALASILLNVLRKTLAGEKENIIYIR